MKIVIISTDTLPIPLIDDIDDIFIYSDKQYSLKDKCSRATGLGVRAWKTGEQLSKLYEITFFVPSINYPGDINIDYNKISKNINFNSYSYENNLNSFDKNLYEELIKFDVILLIQAPSSLCYHVCYQLPLDKILIIDGWVPAILELSAGLLGYSEEYQYKCLNDFIILYTKLIKRSN